MNVNRAFRLIAVLFMIASTLIGCAGASSISTPTPSAAVIQSGPALPVNSPEPDTATPFPPPSPTRLNDPLPASFDPANRYLFYLHGKIIEDQGIPAVSPEFGEYEYAAILEKLAGHGFVVISEQRPKNTDGVKYAHKVASQVGRMLDADVPPEHITIVGASKGAAITAYVSYLLKNERINFVLLGTCHPDTIAEWKQIQLIFNGNVLSIYDAADTQYSGSCVEMYRLSAGRGIARHDEIVLHIGAGHGILFKPLDAWILPTVKWANQ